jgi:transient receptor potential cation channel subfamily V protein 5
MAAANNNTSFYKLLDQKGGGDLVEWATHALKQKDYSFLDGFIESKVHKYLLNDGKGRPIPVAELVKKRNIERNAMLGALRRKKGKGKSGPNILDDLNKDLQQNGDMMKGA